jgi:glycosyltransferase involved in cell wall biosynthesis
MPHIYLINHYATPPGSPTGSRHYDLGRALVQQGYRVTIFAAGYNHFTQQPHPALTSSVSRPFYCEHHNGVRYVWLRSTPYTGNGLGRLFNMLEFAGRLLRLDRSVHAIDQPTLIVGSSVHPFAVWAAKRLATALRVPWCFEIRDLWPQSLIDLGIATSRHPFVQMLKRLERHLLDTTDQVLPVWPGMVDYLRTQGVSPDRITVMPHAVDFAQYPIHYIARPNTSPITLCYFGSHRANNALPPVIHAIAAAQTARPGQLRAVFIGEGDAKPALQALAARIGAAIEFRPGVAKHALGDALGEMDGFVISVHDSPLYRKYGLSFNKLYDAAAIGRPILLASDAPKTLVTEAQAGWIVPPNDVAALTGAILAWLDAGHDERDRRGRNAWTYVRQHHDVRHLAERLIALHRRLTSTRRLPIAS